MERSQRPVPVFPLPGLVLFPHVAIPLHVFELRYRAMVRDALSGDRMLALALLKPGWELDYQGSPEFHPLVCLARILDVEWLPDDCYDLRIKGVARAEVARVVREFPYRAVQWRERPQHPLADDDPLVRIEREGLVESCRRLAALGASIDASDELGFEPLVNCACTLAPIRAEAKLALLAEDSVFDRAVKLRAWLDRLPPAPPEEAEGGEQN